MPALYLVATPIGNMEDITLRAVRVLKEVQLIAAEDTRKTQRLLAAHDIHTPLTSYSEKNKRSKLPLLMEQLRDVDIALVSEAGMPGLSDPGYELINAAIAGNVAVVPIPGASVVLSAVVVSGLPVHQFTYLGFLPRRTGERRRLLSSAADEPRSLVLFEAPHRLRESLVDMRQVLGDRKIAVCRELTKMHEEVYRGTISKAIEYFHQPRGEFTLVVEGKPESKGPPQVTSSMIAQVEKLCLTGVSRKDAVTTVASTAGIPKRLLYQACQRLSG